ncbi:SCO2522 family protein [Nocardia arthritidis]|uniref:Uncharacterized protein n=1 Tax=Nocardia arthritidis TaxID=228602 RepID=A0A6G9Y651_9NOCA|nr:SCO2522 family protein [Nocardia arthritidis]QIS08718.1 hypothetical protein F5544_04020 [Nocardia arthritidis]
METETAYSEVTEQVRASGVKFSHLSIETGHFYMKDMTNGRDRIRAQFRKVARLVKLYTEAAAEELELPEARVSTCFLIDDYFGPNTDPTEIIEKLLDAADECDLRIDYLVREAGCWETPLYHNGAPTGQQIELARMVASRLVAEPLEDTTGRRPPDVESGWLCNGRRSSDHDSIQAMRVPEYRPPVEYGSREHSIFLDVEMWKKEIGKGGEEHIRWSCPFLAAVWQLLRLGMIRYKGEEVVQPYKWQPGDIWPEQWWEMPSVVQLNPHAKPFAAYRAVSILPQEYLKIENAVRVILDHIDLDPDVVDLTVERGRRERLVIPREVSRRLSHVILDDVAKYRVDMLPDGA